MQEASTISRSVLVTATPETFLLASRQRRHEKNKRGRPSPSLTSKFTRSMEQALAHSDRPAQLEQATTSSLEALKAYTTAVRVDREIGQAASIGHYQRAIALDPQFAKAYAALGIAAYNSGQTELAAQATTRAYELRQRATDLERLFITYTYDRQVTGNLERALETLELWAQTAPLDVAPHSLMAGRVTQCTGKYEKSLQESDGRDCAAAER